MEIEAARQLLINTGDLRKRYFGIACAYPSCDKDKAMTTKESIHVKERRTDTELGRLASSMFLLTLDPTQSLSLVIQEEEDGNPILSLDFNARFAFVSHHVLGYEIEDAAALAKLSEQEFLSLLRNAYFQLAVSCEFQSADYLAELAQA
jgi:hypothetical protein